MSDFRTAWNNVFGSPLPPLPNGSVDDSAPEGSWSLIGPSPTPQPRGLLDPEAWAPDGTLIEDGDSGSGDPYLSSGSYGSLPSLGGSGVTNLGFTGPEFLAPTGQQSPATSSSDLVDDSLLDALTSTDNLADFLKRAMPAPPWARGLGIFNPPAGSLPQQMQPLSWSE